MSALPITGRRTGNGKNGAKSTKTGGFGFGRKAPNIHNIDEASEKSITLQDVVASIPQSEHEALALCKSVNLQRLAQQLSFLKLTSKDFNPSHATLEKIFSSGATSADIAMLIESSPWATPLHEDNDFDALAIE